MVKLCISTGIVVFSTIFGWIGQIIGHGWLSLWSIFLSFVGCFFGIWAGFKVGKYYF